jgi:hypothetical protein
MVTLFGRPPAAVDEDRRVAAGVELALDWLRARGISQDPITEEATR